ncbi:hypothetical protein L1987_56318 [Smallanthus sonchifolius]|uniref:Uncharacterized protein n=1 Tax=Smallanthus sonchifolius TaxID=185202 RepID=A0ACB9ECE9_9ASTR|nr:hypothetical protein L1987_56318 [Smallanthus sonchifolius]
MDSPSSTKALKTEALDALLYAIDFQIDELWPHKVTGRLHVTHKACRLMCIGANSGGPGECGGTYGVWMEDWKRVAGLQLIERIASEFGFWTLSGLLMLAYLIGNLGVRHGHVIGGKFKLGRKIDIGSFGELYPGVNLQSKEEVAVKLGDHVGRATGSFNSLLVKFEPSKVFDALMANASPFQCQLIPKGCMAMHIKAWVKFHRGPQRKKQLYF